MPYLTIPNQFRIPVLTIFTLHHNFKSKFLFFTFVYSFIRGKCYLEIRKKEERILKILKFSCYCEIHMHTFYSRRKIMEFA